MTSQTEYEPVPEHLDGPPVNEQPQRKSYWGFSDITRHFLPDNEQYFEIKKMSEGDKAKYQRKTSRDFRVDRDGSGSMKVDPAGDRHELIKAGVAGWYLYGENPAHLEPFSPQSLERFLSVADPELISDIEMAVRKKNPWLLSEMTVAEIDKEILSLQQMREVAVEREKGEGYSSTR